MRAKWDGGQVTWGDVQGDLESQLHSLQDNIRMELHKAVAALESEYAMLKGREDGLQTIWWAVRRTIEGQRRELERYLGRIEASNRDLDAFAGRPSATFRSVGGGGTVRARSV